MMGIKYIQSKPFDIRQTYKIISNSSPVFFVLFPGVDPTKDVENIGQSSGKSTSEMTLINISMG